MIDFTPIANYSNPTAVLAQLHHNQLPKKDVSTKNLPLAEDNEINTATDDI
jgi:uncharacterized protein YggE